MSTVCQIRVQGLQPKTQQGSEGFALKMLVLWYTPWKNMFNKQRDMQVRFQVVMSIPEG